MSEYQERKCGDKKTYRSRAKAASASSTMNHYETLSKTPLMAYKCPLCGGWHIGHRPKKVTV